MSTMSFPPPVIASSNALRLVGDTVLALPTSSPIPSYPPLSDDLEAYALQLEAALLEDAEASESAALTTDDDADEDEDETLWGRAPQGWNLNPRTRTLQDLERAEDQDRADPTEDRADVDVDMADQDPDVDMADATQDSADGHAGGWCGSGGVSGGARLPLPVAAVPLGGKIAVCTTGHGVHEQRRILPLPRSSRADAAPRRGGDVMVEGRGGVRAPPAPAPATAFVGLPVGGSRKRKAAQDEGMRPDVAAAFAGMRELKRPKVEAYQAYQAYLPLQVPLPPPVPMPVQQPRGPLFPTFGGGWGVATMGRAQQVADPWGHVHGQQWMARRMQGPALVVGPTTNMAMGPSACYGRSSWW